MNNFLAGALGAAVANIITFLVYQGFVKSYWGRNVREELTRWWDQLADLFIKDKTPNKTVEVNRKYVNYIVVPKNMDLPREIKDKSIPNLSRFDTYYSKKGWVIKEYKELNNDK